MGRGQPAEPCTCRSLAYELTCNFSGTFRLHSRPQLVELIFGWRPPTNEKQPSQKQGPSNYRKTKASWNPAIRLLSIPAFVVLVKSGATMKERDSSVYCQPDLAPRQTYLLTLTWILLHAGQPAIQWMRACGTGDSNCANYYAKRYNRKLTATNILVTQWRHRGYVLAIAATAHRGVQFLVNRSVFPCCTRR